MSERAANWSVKFHEGGELSGADAEIAEMEGSEPFAYSQAIIDVGAQAIRVEVTWDPREPGATDRATAIAHKLVAAPDMYEALVEARHLFEDDEGIAGVIDAALAKASGEGESGQ